MTRIYEISLTPLGPFFFGGEVVFGGAMSKDERRRSYLVHSQYLPQQTALLGMLREGVLRVHGELITAKDTATRNVQRAAAAKRVGRVGFTLPETGEGFGCIKALSPLVLRENSSGKTWQPQPMDDLKGKNGTSLQWRPAQDSDAEKVTSSGWWLKNFDAKVGLSYQFSDGEQRKGLDDLLSSRSRVGVRVTNRGAQGWRRGEDQLDEDDEEGFYRQTFRLSGQSAYATARAKAHNPQAETQSPPSPPANIALVFRVAIDEENCPKFEELNDATVQLGGERSTFKLGLSKVAEDAGLNGHLREVRYLEKVELPTEGYQRIVLLSDAYIDRDKIARLGGFIVGYSQPFRYFSTNLKKVENFQFLRYDKGLREVDGKGFVPSSGYDAKGRSQSRKHTLLLRGSVILAPAAAPEKTYGADHIINHIESHAAYRRIGYNYCKIAQ